MITDTTNLPCSYCGESHPEHGAVCPKHEQHKAEDAQAAKETANPAPERPAVPVKPKRRVWTARKAAIALVQRLLPHTAGNDFSAGVELDELPKWAKEYILGQMKKPEKPMSRPQRWADAASAAGSALSELQSIQEEYQGWFDNLPENLQQSGLGEKLQTIVDLDIQTALDAAQEAESADLPRGFGND